MHLISLFAAFGEKEEVAWREDSSIEERSFATNVEWQDTSHPDVHRNLQEIQDPWKQNKPIWSKPIVNEWTQYADEQDKYTMLFQNDFDWMDSKLQSLFCEHTESSVEVPCYSVKDRVHKAKRFWSEVIQPENDVMTVIDSGYIIPFIKQPVSYIMKNNKSALDYKTFVSEAIADLLDKQCIYEVQYIPHNVNPLSVACNSSGKKRLILDLSVLNTYLKKKVLNSKISK